MDILDEIASFKSSAKRQNYDNPIDDLLSGYVPPEPTASPYQPTFWDNLLKGGGAEIETLSDPSNPEAAAVVAATGGSLAIMPVAGIAGLSKTITSGVMEGGKTLEEVGGIPARLINTPEQQRAMGEIGKLTEPFAMAGRGIGGLVEGVTNPAIDPQTGMKVFNWNAANEVVQGGAGSNVAVPIGKAIGEISAMFGLPGAIKRIGTIPEAIRGSQWFREMTIEERGLVVLSYEDLRAQGFSQAQAIKRGPLEAYAEQLKSRDSGGAVLGKDPRDAYRDPMRASGADVQGELPAGQGFEMRPRPGEVRDILAEMGEEGPKRLPPGQGFELGSQGARDILAEMGEPGQKALPAPEGGYGEEFTFKPTEAEAPIVTKAGEPFKTEKSAVLAGKGLDWNLYEVTPQGEGFAITRKQGQEIRTPNAPPIDEATRLRAQFDAEQKAKANAPPVVQAETLPIQTAKVSSVSGIVQPGAKLPYDMQKGQDILARSISTWTPEEKAFIVDTGGIFGLMRARHDAGLSKWSKKPAVEAPIVQAKPAEAARQPATGPTNLVTYLSKQGGVNWGPSYNYTEMRQHPDGKRVSKLSGMAPDEAADILNGEGWVSPDGQPFTGDTLAEIIKSDQGRNIFTPDKNDVMMDRQLRRAQNEWIERQLANEADIDPRAVQEGQRNLQDGLIDEIASEGFDLKDEEAALREVADLFPEVKEPAKGKTAEIPGTDTFNLVNPETEIFSGDISKKNMTPTKGFDFGSSRGSIPIKESETLQAILKARGKIEEAMPHLEALGRSVYEGGKQRFLDWQAHMKTKLGDLWESFKAHLKGIFERLQSGKIGPLQNQKGAVGLDINKGPIVKQREIKDAKTGEIRQAPAVYEKEFAAVKKMPELRVKPLGGWLENPIRTFEELGPQIKELFYRPVKEGEHLAKLHFKKIIEKSDAIRKALPGKSSERIGIFAISQQKGGGEILTAMGVKEVPKLTPEELKAYGWMRTGLETFYNKLQEARAAAGKEGFGHVENYFTFARQFALLEKLGFSPIFARGELLQTVMHKKTTPFRYEKHRVGGLTRADLDAFGVFNRYMESATRHYYLSPAISKGREMLLTFHEGETKWILRDEKPGAAKFITEWLDYQAGQRKPQLPNLIEKGLTKLNKNLAFSILSANLRSALIQPSAIVNTVTEIGPRWTYEGIKSMLDNSAVEKSNVLLSRQFDVNVTESLSGLPGRLGKARQAVGNVGMKPLQWLDMQTAKATWNGAYRKGLSEKMSENEARNYADDVVTKTQGSAMPSDMAPVQRTALGKSLTMFQTFVINQWGFLTRDVMGIKNPAVKTPQMVKKVATFIIAASAVNSFYEDVVGVPSPLPSPISAFVKALDKGDSIPSASMDAAAEIASLVPVVGGGVRYGSSMLGAPAEFIGDIGKKLAPNYVGPTRSTAELAAKGLGIPGTSQLVKSLRIANKGGSPVDVVLGRYPEKVTLVQPKTLKGLKGGLK